MASDRSRFIEALSASKLVDEGVATEVIAHLPAEAVGPAVARQLVEAGLLTPYQADELLAGRRDRLFIEKYRILDCLDDTWGVTYRAEHTGLRRESLVRVLPEELSANETALAEFQAQARAIAALDHPNLLRTFDVGHDGARHFVVLEYVETVGLSDYMDEHAQLRPDVALAVTYQIAAALEHALARGVVYHDLSARNVVISTGGVPRLADMGLDRFFRPPQLEEADDPVEAVLSRLQSDASKDVRWAMACLGGTLYYMLTGYNPLPSESLLDALTTGHLEEIPPVGEVVIGLPKPLGRLVQRMVMVGDGAAFRTAGELLGGIVSAARSLPEAMPIDQPIPPPLPSEIPLKRDEPDSEAQALEDLQHIDEERDASTDDLEIVAPPGMIAINKRWLNPGVWMAPTITAIVAVGVLVFLVLDRWINPPPTPPRSVRAPGRRPIRAGTAATRPTPPATVAAVADPPPATPRPAPTAPDDNRPTDRPAARSKSTAPPEPTRSAVPPPAPRLPVPAVAPPPQAETVASRPPSSPPSPPAAGPPAEPKRTTLVVDPKRGLFRNLAEACRAAGPDVTIELKGRVVYRERGIVLAGKKVRIVAEDKAAPIVLLGPAQTHGDPGPDFILSVEGGRVEIEGLVFCTPRGSTPRTAASLVRATAGELVLRRSTFSHGYRGQPSRLAGVRLSPEAQGDGDGSVTLDVEDCFFRDLGAAVAVDGLPARAAMRHCLSVANGSHIDVTWRRFRDEGGSAPALSVTLEHCTLEGAGPAFRLAAAPDEEDLWQLPEVHFAVRHTLAYRGRVEPRAEGLLVHAAARGGQDDAVREKVHWQGEQNAIYDASRRWATVGASAKALSVLADGSEPWHSWADSVSGSQPVWSTVLRLGRSSPRAAQPRDYRLARRGAQPAPSAGSDVDRIPPIPFVSPNLPRAPIATSKP